MTVARDLRCLFSCESVAVAVPSDLTTLAGQALFPELGRMRFMEEHTVTHTDSSMISLPSAIDYCFPTEQYSHHDPSSESLWRAWFGFSSNQSTAGQQVLPGNGQLSNTDTGPRPVLFQSTKHNGVRTHTTSARKLWWQTAWSCFGGSCPATRTGDLRR